MTSRIKRHVKLSILLILMVIVTVIMDRAMQYRIQQEGDCVESLCFTIDSSVSEQEIRCFQDEADQCLYLFLPSYAGADDVHIFFGGGADRIVCTGEKDEVVLKRGADIGALEYGKMYDMRFEDHDGAEMAEQKLLIMHSANLPALFLETESGSMEMVDADKDYEEKGRIILLDVDGSVVCADKLDHISGRGNSSWAYPKKSYGIRLKNRADLLGMGSADDWVLLSNVADRTYIRNKITYEMAVAAKMEGAPESRYIDVYINDIYHGMYQLCEKVEVDTERIAIADLGERNKKLNKDIGSCERFRTEEKKGAVLPAEPEDLTGGYLLERDVEKKYSKEISGFRTQTLGDHYTIKSPKYASPAQVDFISGLVENMEKAVAAENGINPDTDRHYFDYIDLNTFAMKYVIEELSKNQGGGASSSFFYKPEDAVSTKLFAGPVWDYDKAYARLPGIEETTRDLCYLTQRYESTTLFWQLYTHPEFREMVYTCYEDFFSDYIQLVEDEKIDSYITEIHAAADMDSIRWKAVYGETVDWRQKVGTVRTFLAERKEFLDEIWIERKELCTVHFVAEEYERDTYMSVIKGECLQNVPIGEPGERNGTRVFDGWYEEDGTPFESARPVTEDITVYSRSHETIVQEE